MVCPSASAFNLSSTKIPPRKGRCRRVKCQSPRVITLIDGKNETLFSVDDLEYLIDKYMGFDALKYFRALREEQAERENNLARSITDLKAKVHDLTVHIAKMESDFNDQ